MNKDDILRMVDVISREKEIDKETLFLGLEDALAVGFRKRLGAGDDLVVKIDRKTGELSVEDDEEVYEVNPAELGRIAAQAVKQGINQKFREAERDKLYDEYESRVGQLINGTVQRFDGEDLVINLGRVEAYLPRTERVRGETFQPGDRIAPSSRKSARTDRACASRSAAPAATSCVACSSSRSPKSPRRSSRSSAWSASRATAPRWRC